MDVRARQDAVVDGLEEPRAAHDGASELDDVDLGAGMDADGSGRGSSAESDDERGSGARMQGHRQMSDAAMNVGGRGIGAGLVVAVDGERQFVTAILVNDDRRFDAFLLPDDALAGIALRDELYERIG